MKLTDLRLTEAARRMRNGELFAEAYAAALIERGTALAGLNAFIAQNGDAVLAAARAADAKRRAGGPLGALHGVPLAIKDNLDCEGWATTGGTPSLRANRPNRNAGVVEKLLGAGAIVLGKTNMHEMAFGITNNNGAFGPARNPYDPSRIPGGSSGGTGVAVAARLAPGGMGTDTGGSVRIPAALCGIAGLRPSLGRWPTDGILPISPTRDTAGPMAPSVADCALLDAVVTGRPAAIVPRALSALRFGVPRQYFCEALDEEVGRLFEDYLARLRAAGVALVDVDLGAAEELNRAGAPISRYEARIHVARYLREHGIDLTFDDLVAQIASPDVKKILEGGKSITEAEYRRALDTHRTALQKLYADCFTRHGLTALIFPTVPLPAAKIGADDMTELNGHQLVSTFAVFTRNTGPGSVAGLPGLAMPIGLTTAGLPVGIELDGPVGSDEILLGAGLALENNAPPMPAPREQK